MIVFENPESNIKETASLEKLSYTHSPSIPLIIRFLGRSSLLPSLAEAVPASVSMEPFCPMFAVDNLDLLRHLRKKVEVLNSDDGL